MSRTCVAGRLLDQPHRDVGGLDTPAVVAPRAEDFDDLHGK
jgi:hypothetical protein